MSLDTGLLDSKTGNSIQCRFVRMLTVVENETRCATATSLLLDWAHRRWSGRNDVEHFPPIQRWRAIESGYLDGVERAPEALIRAAASGRRARKPVLAQDVRDAVVLHSGCPALVQTTQLPDTGLGALAAAPRRAVLISIYALAEDDLALAESVVAGCVSVGALSLVERFTRWLTLPIDLGIRRFVW